MEKFKVVLVGTQPGADQAMVVRNLSQLFKTDPGRIEAMMQKPQTVIKTDLTKEAAEKYKTALEKAGASAKVISTTPAKPKPPLTTPEPAPMRLERQEEIQRPTPKATCPGCGYEAMDSDDPLITAHGGEGECPKCGIVPKKVARTQAVQAADSFPDGDVKIIGAKSGSGFPIARIAIVAVVVLVIAGGWYFLSRDTGSTTSARKSNAVDKARAVVDKVSSRSDELEEGSGETKSSTILIPPGQRQTLTLTGPVLYMHKSEGAGRIDGAYGVAEDNCSEQGLQVDFYDSYIDSEQFPIWTAGSEIKNIKTGKVSSLYQPVRTGGTLFHVPWDPKTETFPVAPIELNDPGSLRHQGEMSLEDAKKNWNRTPDVQVFGYETRRYTFYFFTVRFTVNVPPEEDLPAVETSSRGNKMFVSFGPTKLVFSDGDSQTVLVDGGGTRQASVGFSVYNLTGQYKGVHVTASGRGCNLTTE